MNGHIVDSVIYLRLINIFKIQYISVYKVYVYSNFDIINPPYTITLVLVYYKIVYAYVNICYCVKLFNLVHSFNKEHRTRNSVRVLVQRKSSVLKHCAIQPQSWHTLLPIPPHFSTAPLKFDIFTPATNN